MEAIIFRLTTLLSVLAFVFFLGFGGYWFIRYRTALADEVPEIESRVLTDRGMDLLLEEVASKDHAILCSELALGSPITLFFVFYSLRWVFTGRKRPWVPK